MDAGWEAPTPSLPRASGRQVAGTGSSRARGAVTKPVEVTNPDKLLWPALAITKRRYVDYLDAVRDRMLPWLRERPLTLVRAPDGVGGERYYQKDTPRYAPSWIRTVAIPAPSAKREVAYIGSNETPTLAWLGNQAALEFHPAPVRRDRLERPDLLTVDIDPPTTPSTPRWRWPCWSSR